MIESNLKVGNNPIGNLYVGSSNILGGNPNTFEIQSEYGGIATFVLINKSSNPITITNWVSDGRGGVVNIPVNGVYTFDYIKDADDFSIVNSSNRTLVCKRSWIYSKDDGEMDFVMCQKANVAPDGAFIYINDHYYSNLYVGVVTD